MPEEQAADDAKKGRKKSNAGLYNCQVNCLDGSIIKADVDRNSQGEVLFNKVIRDLSITEKEYVGLNFANEKGLRLWLDIHKEMKHQIGEHSDVVLNFRVKFYEPEPSRIKDVFLRYLFYLQLREDLTEGKLKCHENTYSILGSYTVQAELGNFNVQTHDDGYLKDYIFAPEQTSNLIKRVHELHREHRGQSPAQAEINFLEVAKKIPRYGVDIHEARDNEGDVEIGIAAIGIYIYRFSRKEYLFRWHLVDTVLYSRRKITIKILEGVPKAGEESAVEDDIKLGKKPQLTFIYYFDSTPKCKQCYKASVECHTFFRLARPDTPRKKTDSLKLGSSFRYTDRTLYQLRHRPNNDEDPATDVPFTRTPSKRRGTDTPRGSWIPDDEHIKDRDTELLEDAHHLSLVDDEKQYEEMEIDEASVHVVPPKKKKIDEIPVKTLLSPLMNEQYYADQDFDMPIQSYRESITPRSVNVESEPVLDLEEPKMYMEEVEIDEKNPEDSWYDPSEWDVVERTMPYGTKKRYRVRLVEADAPIDTDLTAVVEKKAMEMEEVEIDENDPEDSKYDPKEWDVVERREPDGTKKRFRRRYFVKTVKPVPEETRPEEYNPTEWELAEKILPDGKKQVVRRRGVVTKLQYVNKKPCDVPRDEPLAIVEEVEIDQDNPRPFDPNQWEVIEKSLPNGEIIPVRRRIVITRYQFFNKKPSEVDPNEPLTEIEEVEIGEDQPDGEQYDPDEWEVEEVVQPDGTSKYVCRRVIITRVEYVYKRPSDVTTDEQPVAELEEMDIDEENPDDDKYNPNEWELAGKTTPEGKQIRVRRRYIIRRVHITYKKPSDVPPDDRRSRVEEIEIDEENPEDEKYDPNQWEIVEKTSPGCMGKVKRVRRRIVVTRVRTLHRMPSEISHDDPLKEAIKDDDVDPEEWEVANITLANGEKKTGRRRYLVPRVSTEYKLPSEIPANHPFAEIEEVELSPMYIEDRKFEPDELADGRRKPVHRIYKIKGYIKEYKKPCDVASEIPIAVIEEAEIEPTHIVDDMLEPDGWEICEKTLPDGTTKKVRRRCILTCKQSTDEVAADVPHIEVEESLINQNKPEDDKYDPTEWDVVEKVTPCGENKLYRCRIKVTKVAKVYYKESDVIPNDQQGGEIEEVDMDEELPDNFDPAEWDIVEKPLPDGTTKRIRRRFVITRVEVLLRKPSELTDDEPLGVSVEEFPLNDAEKPNVDYDPTEWEVVEKPCPDGTKQRVRRRIVVKCIKKEKPPVQPDEPISVVEEEMVDSTPVDNYCSKKIMRRRSIKTTITPLGGKTVSVSTEEVPKQTEEVEIDESDPQDEKYDSKEWETIQKLLPDGTVKRFRRRVVETVITTVNKKYGDTMIDGVPLRMEEFEIDDAHPENDKLDPSECEILEKTLPDGSWKRYSRRIIASALPGSANENEPPALYEEVEIDELNPDNDNFDAEEWEVLEKALPDGSKKRFRRRKLNVITVHKKPIAITAGDAPLRVQEVEVDEVLDQDFNLEGWEVVEKTLPDGRKKKFHRKILTTIFSSLNEKNEMTENPPIHIEEVEIYEASSDDEDTFSPTEWEVTDKVLPGGRITKVYTRSSVTVITPKGTMKLEDKSVEETPVVAEEVELDETAPSEHYDPEEWDIIERKLPDGTTKRFHRRVIRKYKKVPSHELVDVSDPMEVEEVPVEEFELDEADPDEVQKYNTPEWEIVEKTMPDGSVKRFRRKIITTVVTTVTTKTIVVHPDGREEVVDIETTPGEETTLESIDGGLETLVAMHTSSTSIPVNRLLVTQ